jgi:hypothetical protein
MQIYKNKVKIEAFADQNMVIKNLNLNYQDKLY